MVSNVFFGTIEQASRNVDIEYSGNEDIDLQIEVPAERMLSSFIFTYPYIQCKKNVSLQGGWIIV